MHTQVRMDRWKYKLNLVVKNVINLKMINVCKQIFFTLLTLNAHTHTTTLETEERTVN